MPRVLLTGGGGFIGSHLAELCVERGYEVRAFLHYNAAARWGWLDEVTAAAEMEIVTGDIRDHDSVTRAARGCDQILHLAALIGIPYSYVSPLAYIRTNIEGTYNVLEAARNLEISKVVVTSTSEVYGTAQEVPMDEQHPLRAQSPYAATKIAADQLALSYHRSFGLDVRIVRPFNTYGPRQSARAVIPSIIIQLLAGKERIQLGNIHCTRDFTFVRDTAEGFLAAAAADNASGTVMNLGTGSEISIEDLAERIAAMVGVSIEIETSATRIRGSTTEVERLCASPRFCEGLTGWSARVGIDEGLGETVEWYRPRMALYRPEIYGI